MKKMMFLYVALILLVAGIGFYQSGKLDFLNSTSPKATVNNKKFDLILAKTAQEKTTGLSKRYKLPENSGMLFIFNNKDYYQFWMKEMRFPIDIIYINDDKIVDIFENVKPPQGDMEVPNIPIYTPREKANYVLEINAGLSKKLNIKSGNKVTLKNITL